MCSHVNGNWICIDPTPNHGGNGHNYVSISERLETLFGTYIPIYTKVES